MVFVPDVYQLRYRGEFGLWLHTNGTRLRDPAEWCGVRRPPGEIIISPHVPPETGDVVMATYLLFGKYSSEALKGISAKRSEDAKALFKKHGGELRAA